MNKLEKEIHKALVKYSEVSIPQAKAAAAVAMRYIEKAFEAGEEAYKRDRGFGWIQNYSKEQWIKENIS